MIAVEKQQMQRLSKRIRNAKIDLVAKREYAKQGAAALFFLNMKKEIFVTIVILKRKHKSKKNYLG